MNRIQGLFEKAKAIDRSAVDCGEIGVIGLVAEKKGGQEPFFTASVVPKAAR